VILSLACAVITKRKVLLVSDLKPQQELNRAEARRQRLKLHSSVSLDRKTIWTMTSAVNVRSQLIRGIFIFTSLIIQCDGQTNNCGSGKVRFSIKIPN